MGTLLMAVCVLLWLWLGASYETASPSAFVRY